MAAHVIPPNLEIVITFVPSELLMSFRCLNKGFKDQGIQSDYQNTYLKTYFHGIEIISDFVSKIRE